MAENLIVPLQITIDSVPGLLDSLDCGEAGNTGRIWVLESLVYLQLRTLLSRWELLAIVAVSCMSICPIRGFPTVSPRSQRVGDLAFFTSAGVSLEYNMIFLVSNNGNVIGF